MVARAKHSPRSLDEGALVRVSGEGVCIREQGSRKTRDRGHGVSIQWEKLNLF